MSSKSPRTHSSTRGKATSVSGSGRARKTACNLCGARVKPENLDEHMERVHPEGEASEEALRTMNQIKMAARRESFANTVRMVVPVVIVVVLLLLVYYVVAVYEPPPDEAPGWKLKEVNDNTEYDSEDYFSDGVTLIEFFHTECHTCGEMADVYNDIYTNFSGKVNGMFSIGGYTIGSSGHTDTSGTILKFKNEHGSPWPHLFDPSHKLMRDYGASGFPTLYIIKDKEIVETLVGSESYNHIATLIEKHLE